LNPPQIFNTQRLYVSRFEVNATFLSAITGYSAANIDAIVQQYNGQLRGGISVKPRGGRKRLFMSIDAAKELMKGLETMAMKGKFLTYLDVKKIIEKQLNRSVFNETAW
jgi:hypothetical protein